MQYCVSLSSFACGTLLAAAPNLGPWSSSSQMQFARTASLDPAAFDNTLTNNLKGMQYPQRYSWVMRFDDKGIIVQVRAYLDSALVQRAIDQNS